MVGISDQQSQADQNSEGRLRQCMVKPFTIGGVNVVSNVSLVWDKWRNVKAFQGYLTCRVGSWPKTQGCQRRVHAVGGCWNIFGLCMWCWKVSISIITEGPRKGTYCIWFFKETVNLMMNFCSFILQNCWVWQGPLNIEYNTSCIMGMVDHYSPHSYLCLTYCRAGYWTKMCLLHQILKTVKKTISN